MVARKAAPKKALKDPNGGLTAAGRAHFKKTEGANLRPGVKGPADTPVKMKRKGSFLRRHYANLVHGPDGLIDLDPAFSFRGRRLFIQKGTRREERRLGEVNHFAAEMDHFSACVLEDKGPRTPGAEGVADLRVIAAIAEAARSGKAVKVER